MGMTPMYVRVVQTLVPERRYKHWCQGAQPSRNETEVEHRTTSVGSAQQKSPKHTHQAQQADRANTLFGQPSLIS